MTPVPFLDLAAGTKELGKELEDAFAHVLHTGQYVLGHEVESFEQEFAHFSGAPYCIGVGSGYDALVLALRALDVRAGDDVLVSAATHVSTWLAIRALGARPIGIEPDSLTGTPDPSRLDDAWTERVTALLVVHLYGRPAAMNEILAWAKRRDIVVVADAAQAHGATYDGQPLGALGDAVAWSFYPSKNLGALGDAGAVTTSSLATSERIRRLRNYGSERRDVVVECGVNSRLDEFQAAFLRVKLRHLDAWNARRRAVAEKYDQELATLPLLRPKFARDDGNAWHLYVIQVERRDELRAALANEGIETLVHYPTPPFAQRAFADLHIDATNFPLTTQWSEHSLSLPFGPHLRNDQQREVVAALGRFFEDQKER